MNQNQNETTSELEDQDEGYDIAELLTDEKKEVEGIWRDLPKGARVRVGRWQNEDFQRMMRRKFKSNRVMLEQEDDLSDKVSLDILIEVMAHTILKDVEKLKMKGKVIEKYTPEVGMQLLRVKDFRDRIRAFAEDVTDFRIQQENEAVKG